MTCATAVAMVVFATGALAAAVLRGDGGADVLPAEPCVSFDTRHRAAAPEAALMQRVVLSDADGGVCLDGTPASAYVRKGHGDGAAKWYIHHEGGGWCTSLDACAARAQMRLGSTRNDTATLKLDWAYFATDPALSPFWNWNAVFLRYCDGASFAGDNETVVEHGGQRLHFRGRRILHAAIAALLDPATGGLGRATDIVVSGCSAGGLAAFLHVDEWVRRVRAAGNSAARIAAMPDSGYFKDYDSAAPDGPRYATDMRWVFDAQNCTAGVNQRCVAANADAPHRCFFAEHTAPHLATRTFALESRYDSWQLRNVLGSTDADAVNKFGDALAASIDSRLLAGPAKHGAFVTSCSTHCGVWDKVVGGVTAQDAFMAFFHNDTGAVRRRIDERRYKCDVCCDGDHAVCARAP